MVINMKKILSIFLAFLMIVSLASCGNSSQSAGANSTNETGTEADTETKAQTIAQDSAEAPASEESAGTADSQEKPAASGKTLVVYYSASGNTGRVAEFVADELGADTFEIIPAEVYSDEDLDWTNRDSRVCKEHDDPSLQDIELVSTEVPGWNEYDVVLFGYPIWWREASWVVNTLSRPMILPGKP